MAAVGENPAQAIAAKGLSLHIGLNNVDQGHYDESVAILKNCLNDANAMAELALSQGFSVLNVLLEDAGTKAAVKSAVADAAGQLKAGDIFLFTYSGHGSQVIDQNEDELKNVRPDGRPDRHDETWCLYDGMMVDDEVNLMWQAFAPGVRVLVLLDCCHSETSIRGVGERGARKAPGLSRRLSLSATAKVQRKNRAFYAAIQTEMKAVVARPIVCSVEVISACEDDQEAADGAPNGNGFFTEQLLAAWDNGNFNGSLGEFYEIIKEYMSVADNQTPMPFRDGAQNAEFFAQRPFSI
jgi:metacaspase-1